MVQKNKKQPLPDLNGLYTPFVLLPFGQSSTNLPRSRGTEPQKGEGSTNSLSSLLKNILQTAFVRMALASPSTPSS